MGLLGLGANQTSFGQCTDSCPAGATDTGLAVGGAAFRINPDGSTGSVIGNGFVGACSKIRLRMNVSYSPIGPSGGANVAFSGGHMVIKTTSGSFSQDVTPVGGVPIIAPLSDTGAGGCAAGGTPNFNSNFTVDYDIAAHQSDIVANHISFTATYGPQDTIAYTCPPLLGQSAGSTPIQVTVLPAPSCIIAPASQSVCLGSPIANLVITPTSAPDPVTGQPIPVHWVWSSSDDASFSAAPDSPKAIPSPTVPGTYHYRADVTDVNGCTSFCTATVTVFPNPTCNLAPATQTVCLGSPVAALTVTPSGGTAPYSLAWSSSDDAGFSAPANSLSATPTPSVAGTYHYRVDVTDANGCKGFCTATVTLVACKPQISVLKEVACALNATDCGTFGPTATGTKGDTCPAFCWKITITNTDPAVDVGSVVALDPLLGGDISSHFTGFPLKPGASTSYTIPGQTLCDPHTTNTVTVTPYGGAGATGTAGDSKTSSAIANVEDIQLACKVSLTLENPAFDLDGNPTDNKVTLSAGSTGVQIQVNLQLINNGSADLIVRSVSDLPPLVTCDLNETPLTDADIAAALGLPLSIPAGGSSTMALIGCWIVGCPGGTFAINARAEADDKNNTICVHDVTGAIVSTTTKQACPAEVICQVPASCRVTGGGVLLPGETQTGTCSPDVVTAVQGPACNLTEAVKITHGGQLGAPYANETCGNVALFPLGDPCIRGQWEHVRHYQGKANPKSTVAVDNWHSNTPKGIFDMVKCACLPCCENPEAGGKVGNLCNPSDHKICGPMPRPAPSNAIIFTGIGYMSSCATANAKKGRTEAVIFRVYVEDRSEPGGQHPGGGKKPADIYSFQAWSLSDINGDNSGKIDTAKAIAARQALADDSCAFIEHYTQGSLPDSTLLGTPVVNDSGALHTGNQQIHPSTSATCPDAVVVQ